MELSETEVSLREVGFEGELETRKVSTEVFLKTWSLNKGKIQTVITVESPLKSELWAKSCVENAIVIAARSAYESSAGCSAPITMFKDPFRGQGARRLPERLDPTSRGLPQCGATRRGTAGKVAISGDNRSGILTTIM